MMYEGDVRPNKDKLTGIHSIRSKERYAPLRWSGQRLSGRVAVNSVLICTG